MELRAPGIATTTRQGWSSRRRERREVGVRMGLPFHDEEVEGVVVEDDAKIYAVLVLGVRGRARYAQAHVPKRRSRHRVPRVPQGWLLRHEELVGLLGSAVRRLLSGKLPSTAP